MGVLRFCYYRSRTTRTLLSKCHCRPLSWLSSENLSPRQMSTCHRSNEDFFITTPIFYVNGEPHLGHMYTAVLADTLARWHKLKTDTVLFSTGTDEHGLKVQQAAQHINKSPKAFCDDISLKFQVALDKADVKYTDFIRTTDDRHKRAVEHIWTTLEQRGHIYKGKYEGWYCIADEAFLTEDKVLDQVAPDGQMVKVSVESGRPVEWTSEENYMFTLSQFGPQLLKWLDTGAVRPAQFAAQVRGWVEQGLPDLSVSRQQSRLQWGIPVPTDPSQTIYVWLDALVNYLTVAGYPDKLSSVKWPATCHVVGKDIIRFHAVYWPAFLLAAGLELPHSILCHSHWLCDGEKMSKTLGNVVDPVSCMELYGTDGLRYFLMREGVPHSDGNFTDARVIECLNAELCNTLGNLLQRCTSSKVNKSAEFPPYDQVILDEMATSEDMALIHALHSLPDKVAKHYDSYEVWLAITAVMEQLRQTNSFVHRHAPWDLARHPEQAAWHGMVLHVSMETLRVAGVLLSPVIPTLANNIFHRLGVSQAGTTLGSLRDWREEASIPLGPANGLLYPRIKT